MAEERTVDEYRADTLNSILGQVNREGLISNEVELSIRDRWTYYRPLKKLEEVPQREGATLEEWVAEATGYTWVGALKNSIRDHVEWEQLTLTTAEEIARRYEEITGDGFLIVIPDDFQYQLLDRVIVELLEERYTTADGGKMTGNLGYEIYQRYMNKAADMVGKPRQRIGHEGVATEESEVRNSATN